MKLAIDVNTIKGFLAADEGQALYESCRAGVAFGPALEIGSYCGKSTVYLGQACKDAGSTLFALDHHRGSEEHQLGEEYHDPELFDAHAGLMDSFKVFRDTLRRANLEDCVVPVVTSSAVAARHWQTPLGFVFIDGGHSLEAATTDFDCWSGKVAAKGILAIHDLFPDPTTGGQAPITIWRRAIESGLFEDIGVVNTLGILRRKDC